MLMRFIPHDALVRKAAQQCLGTELVQAGEVLQGRVFSCKTEVLTPHRETEEDGELSEVGKLSEVTSLSLDAYWSRNGCQSSNFIKIIL